MKKILDNYFDKAKLLIDESLPYSEADLTALLNRKNPKNVKMIKGLIIMTALIISIVTFFILNTSDVTDKIPSKSIEPVSNAKSENVTLNNTNNQNSSVHYSMNEKISSSKESSNAVEESIAEDISNQYITKVDENGEIKRPFTKTQTQSSSSFHSFSLKENGLDLLEPAKLKTNTSGEAIPGVTILQLTNEELKNIGIICDNEKLEFNTEEYNKIHPIPFRNDNSYHYNYYVYPYFKAGYPTTGESFLVRKHYKIDLNYQYNPEKDTIYDTKVFCYQDSLVTDVIDGMEIKLSRMVVMNPPNPKLNYLTNQKLIGLTQDQISFLNEKSNIGFKKELINYNGWNMDSYSQILPVCYAFKYNPIDRKVESIIGFSPLFPKRAAKNFKINFAELLPLEIKFDKSKLIERIVFWFVPTDELINKLPMRYSTSLKNEMEVIRKIKNGLLPATQACEEIKDKSYLDVCKISSGAVTIENIYPNPIINVSYLTFSLSADREITIDIHNFMGNCVGNLIKDKSLQAGKHKLEINISGIQPGIYILSLKTNKGEMATQRIIIN
jgi:hypothetical protein